MAKKPVAKKLAISLASLAVALPLLEYGLRWGEFDYPPKDEPIAIWNRIEDQNLRLGLGLHQTEKRQLWAPRPGADIPWGTDERVNEAGYRGPLRPRQKEPGVLRIATLGDSSTFGYGVAYADTYSSQLEELLKGRGLKVEVLDFGVVGFTVRQGLERYKSAVRPYEPDIVVEAFGAVNDHHAAQNDQPDIEKIAKDVADQGWFDEMLIRWRKDLRTVHLMCKLADLMRGGYYKERDIAFRKVRFQENLAKRMGKLEFDEHKGVRRVSLADFQTALVEFRGEVEKDGAKLVALSMPRMQVVEKQAPVLLQYSRLIHEITAREGIPCAEGRKSFLETIEAGTPEADLYVHGDNYHPSHAGHALLAKAVAEKILELTLPH
jgi:lysophospholipase L1-like esterase